MMVGNSRVYTKNKMLLQKMIMFLHWRNYLNCILNINSFVRFIFTQPFFYIKCRHTSKSSSRDGLSVTIIMNVASRENSFYTSFCIFLKYDIAFVIQL